MRDVDVMVCHVRNALLRPKMLRRRPFVSSFVCRAVAQLRSCHAIARSCARLLRVCGSK